MECSVCGGQVEPIHKASGICESCANLLGEMGPSGLEALSRQQKRYAALKEIVEKLKTVNHRQAEDISGLDLAYKSADRDRNLLKGEIAGLKNVDIPAFQNQLALANLQLSELQKEVERLKGPCTCEHDPQYAGGACGICHAEALLGLETIAKACNGEVNAVTAYVESVARRALSHCIKKRVEGS